LYSRRNKLKPKYPKLNFHKTKSQTSKNKLED